MAPCYSTKLDEATALALEAFRGKTRKGCPVPYVTHLFAVTALVGEHGGDEETLIAAMLHDYLEDIDGASADEVRARFGARVADMVVALSDATSRPKPPWIERKTRYIAHLTGADPATKLIAAADKLHNARAIARDLAAVGLSAFDRFSAPRDGTLWYYREVVRALGTGWEHAILEELRAEVDLLHENVARASRPGAPGRVPDTSR